MTIANNYEIIKRLGHGGMGVVYLAKDLALDKLVALKMLTPQLAQDEKFLARFRLEARAQAKFDHSHIVRIHTFVEDQGNYFLVMEYVEGTTLDALIHDSPHGMPVEQAWPLLDQILSAFEYAHNLGIIHRDIKPKNILIQQPGAVAKVADFGLARVQGQAGLTVTSSTGGTLAYMSPEQIENLADVDYRTDIYSLGMTMYEMLTGYTPFVHEESDLNIRLAIAKGKIPNIRKIKPNLSRELASVVMTALAVDPDDRYRSVGEMRRALLQIVATTRGSPAKTASLRLARKRYWPMFLGLLFTLLLVWLTIQAMTQSESGWLSALQAWFQTSSKPQPTRPVTTQPPPRLNFEVQLTTMPDGVTVDVNGRLWGRTPLRDSLHTGTYRLLFTKLGYYPLDTTLMIETDFALHVPLRAKMPEIPKPPTKYSLRVLTNPVGATATLNDGQTITTPNFFKNLSRKSYLLRVYKDRYQTFEKQINPADYENRAVVIDLLPVAPRSPEPPVSPPRLVNLTVDVRPFGTILIDETIVASDHSGVYKTEVPPGTHRITIRHTKGRWMKLVEVAPGRQNHVTVDFRQKVDVTITAFDESGKPVPATTIVIDGVAQDMSAPASVALGVGLHEITVTKTGYYLVNPPLMPILLEADRPQVLQFRLQR